MIVAVWALALSVPWLGCVRVAMLRGKSAVLEQTTTIKAGYMKKASPVHVRRVSKDLYVHVAHHEPWLAAAIGNTHRSLHPLKGNTFLHALRAKATEQLAAKQRDSQEPELHDLMESLEAGGSALAELATPQKRARTKMVVSAEEAEGPIDVRVADVVPDINVFPPGERPTIEQACLRVLCGSSSGKGGPKMLYVWEEHLDLFVSVLVVLVSRMGVPLAAVPEHSALAGAGEWFDISTNRWHLRQGDTEEVLVSDPVPRLGLTVAEFQKCKASALEALKSRS